MNAADKSEIAYTDWLALDDATFESQWFGLPLDQKDALPADVRRRCSDRYSRLHAYVSKSTKRIRDADIDPLDAVVIRNPTQDNIALLFTKRHANKLLYAHKFGCWFRWTGTRWERDATRMAFQFCREIARQANQEGKKTLATSSFAHGVEDFARADPAHAIVDTELDADNYLLNTPAGTYDLRTGIRRDHDARDLISKVTAVSPSREGGTRFEQFMHEVTGNDNDNDLYHFLRVALGACLSGAIEDHWLMFWTGAGRNGKNTLGDLIMYVLGDYAKKVPMSTLMAQQNEGHPTDMANLAGVRLAVSSEVNSGDHWNESRINELTGDAMISARFMRQDFFEFKRTHKHLIYGNHSPQLRSATVALKSRLKIVPFRQSFAGREDKDLPTKLEAEAGYFLQWLIDGHMLWFDGGKKLPECVAVDLETVEYFANQATTDLWVCENCDLIADDTRNVRDLPKAGDLYADYRQWKEGRGEKALSMTRWGGDMQKHVKRVESAGIRYAGISLKSYAGFGGYKAK